MNIRIFTVFAIAAALCAGQPAFAAKDRKGASSHRAVSHHVAATHRSTTSRAIASTHHATRAVAAVHHGTRSAIAARRVTTSRARLTANRSSARAVRGIAARNSRGRTIATAGRVTSARRHGANVALVGSPNGSGNRVSQSNYTYAFQSHSGWNQNREYYWHNHHYRWFGNGWFIINPFPYTYYNRAYYSPGYFNSYSLITEVQQDLANDGYYHGSIDGVYGPMTQAAIVAYQQDNGLVPTTGTIGPALLNSLNG